MPVIVNGSIPCEIFFELRLKERAGLEVTPAYHPGETEPVREEVLPLIYDLLMKAGFQPGDDGDPWTGVFKLQIPAANGEMHILFTHEPTLEELYWAPEKPS